MLGRIIEPIGARELLAVVGTADAPSFLHELVGRLLRDAPGTSVQGFAPEEGLGVHGWDGVTDRDDEIAFVPQGAGYWELSAQRDSVEAKATRDYDSRAAKPRGANPSTSTYVALTLQRWPGKVEWRRRRIASGVWRDVRTLDVDDLAVWLTKCPAVHKWATAWVRRERFGFAAHRAPAELPASPAGFIDRSVLAERLDRGFALPDGPHIATVWGGPGSGKTSLAVRYANGIADRYPDGVFFEDARGADGVELDVERLQRRIIEALRTEDAEDAVLSADRQAQYRTATADRRILIVVDNVVSERIVRDLWPNSAGSAVISTSRRRLSGLDGTIDVEVSRLSSEEAVEMLASIVGTQAVVNEYPAAEDLVERCARVPLAVRIAGSIAAVNPGWGLRHVETLLRDGGATLDKLQHGDRAVRTTFQVSFSLLSPAAADLFIVVAMIPGRYFDSALAEVALDASAAVPLRELAEFGLVERAQEVGEYLLHDLSREFAEEVGETREHDSGVSARPIFVRIANHLLRNTHECVAALNPSLQAFAETNGITVTVSHQDAVEWLDRRIENMVRCIPVMVDRLGQVEPVVSVAPSVLNYFAMRAQWSQQRDVARFVRECLHHVREAESEWEMSDAAFALQEAEALVRMARTEEAGAILDAIRPRLDTTDSPVLAAAFFNALGNLASAIGDYDEALIAFRDAERLSRDVNDADAERAAHYNVGRTLGFLGQQREALGALESELKATRGAGDEWSAAISLNLIGITLTELDRAPEAVPRLKEALAIFRRFGDKDNEANAMFDLGIAYSQSKRPADALRAWQSEISIRTLLGDEENIAHTRATIVLICAVQELDGPHLPDDPELAELIDELSAGSRKSMSYASQVAAAQAILYHRRGRRDEAEASIIQAIELAEASRASSAIVGAAVIEVQVASGARRRRMAIARARGALGAGDHPALRRAIDDAEAGSA